MFLRIGTLKGVGEHTGDLPSAVFTEVARTVEILDREYGEGRDYSESGGYVIYADCDDDLKKLSEVIDFKNHPFEEARLIGKERRFVSVLFLMNDDYSVTVILPARLAPKEILEELSLS